MKLALYLGCTIQSEQYGYELSVRETLPKLGIELQDMEGSSCCGFPALNSVSKLGWHYLSARNLSIAENMGLPILPLCNGCYLSLLETKHSLATDSELKNVINMNLEKEGFTYRGNIEIMHIFEVLNNKIVSKKISDNIIRPLKGIKLAAHPGCHAIRPSNLNKIDDPENPQILDRLLTSLGAETYDYPEKIDCCGSQLAVTSGRITLRIAAEKLKAVKSYGFDGLVTTCPFCFNMYDGRQRAIKATIKDTSLDLPVFYYTQLLGLSMGIDPIKLGLQLNQSPVDNLVKIIMEK